MLVDLSVYKCFDFLMKAVKMGVIREIYTAYYEKITESAIRESDSVVLQRAVDQEDN